MANGSEAVKQFFLSLAVAIFYPIGAFKLIMICSRNRLSGRKRFATYSLFGFISWGFIARSFFEQGILMYSMATIGVIMYLAFLILFARLCYAKTQEVEEERAKMFRSYEGIGSL